MGKVDASLWRAEGCGTGVLGKLGNERGAAATFPRQLHEEAQLCSGS